MTMTEILLVVFIIIGILIMLMLYLLRREIKKIREDLLRTYVDPCEDPISIKLKCIDKQLKDFDKKLRF